MADDREFADGMYFSEGKQGFIHLTVSINREKVINWLKKKDDEYINIDVKTSKQGKMYGQVNNFGKDKSPFDQSEENQQIRQDTGQPAYQSVGKNIPSKHLRNFQKEKQKVEDTFNDVISDDDIPF
tara:strand:+ start:1374 stop:1751 length:378 start_codon:yes stop_codon:yes gene_type:complete